MTPTGDTFAGGQRFDVLQKGRKASDDFPPIKIVADFAKRVERNTGFLRTRGPDVGDYFLRLEFTLQRRENPPLQIVERRHRHIGYLRGHVRLAARIQAASPHVADPQREQPFGRKQNVPFRSGLLREKLAVLPHRITLRHFERRPEFVV